MRTGNRSGDACAVNDVQFGAVFVSVFVCAENGDQFIQSRDIELNLIIKMRLFDEIVECFSVKRMDHEPV